jgi:hypothetical protein
VVLSFVGSLLCLFHYSVMEKTQQYVSRLLSMIFTPTCESTELALASSPVHPFVVVTTLTSRGQWWRTRNLQTVGKNVHLSAIWFLFFNFVSFFPFVYIIFKTTSRRFELHGGHEVLHSCRFLLYISILRWFEPARALNVNMTSRMLVNIRETWT